jgi:hypothetical protein
MTRYRYDVWLDVERRSEPRPSPLVMRWQPGDCELTQVLSTLRSRHPSCLMLKDVPNARLRDDAALLRILETADALMPAAGIHERLRDSSGPGVEPEALWRIADDASYQCFITYAESGLPFNMDVALVRDAAGGEPPAACAQLDRIGNHALREYANSPLRDRVHASLSALLRRDLAQQLPDYMVPAKLVVVEALPVGPSGKIARRALAAAPLPRTGLSPSAAPPSTNREETLAAIWREVLQVDAVGVHDNFFNVGGTSLLLVEVFNRLLLAGERDLTLTDLFEHRTIHALATYLEQPAVPDRPARTHAGDAIGAAAGSRARLLELNTRRLG